MSAREMGCDQSEGGTNERKHIRRHVESLVFLKEPRHLVEVIIIEFQIGLANV